MFNTICLLPPNRIFIPKRFSKIAKHFMRRYSVTTAHCCRLDRDQVPEIALKDYFIIFTLVQYCAILTLSVRVLVCFELETGALFILYSK